MKKPKSASSSFALQDSFSLLACWFLFASISGVALFEPLRELLEPVVLAEAADRIESKIRLAEIALETREPDELPSTPEILASAKPENASGKLSNNDLELIDVIAKHEGVSRTFLVAPPSSSNWLGGYWILLDVKGKSRPYWLYSRSSVSLSSWFLPLWRTILLVIGVMIGTLVFLRLRLSNPLGVLVKTLEEAQGNHFKLIKPHGVRPIKLLINQINKLYEQINFNGMTRRNLLRAISHDLRAPLTRMRILTELDSSIEPGQLLSDLHLLTVLSDQIAALSEEEGENEDVQLFMFDQFVWRIASSYPGESVVVEASDVVLMLNVNSFQRALHNLIDNGLEYGKPPITISVVTSRGQVRIIVDDCGLGLKTGTILAMPRIPRADDRGQQRHSGLGLQIAESFCRQSGGSLQLEPSPKGGLRVVLALPAAVLRGRNA